MMHTQPSAPPFLPVIDRGVYRVCLVAALLQTIIMNVDGSSFNSSSSVGGSIPMDRLKQFVEEDVWFFNEDDSGESDDDTSCSESSSLQDPDESLLPKEGHWIDLCNSTASANSQRSPSSGSTTDDTNPFEQSMGLQSVIDHFLSKLEPYSAAYDEEESTDHGGKKGSDTHLLLEENHGTSPDIAAAAEDSGPVQTPQKEANIPLDQQLKEEDHTKPLLPVASSSKKPKYFFIANEILTSERTFVQGIRMLEKVLHGAIRTARDAGQPIIPESLRKRIFLNISEIHTLNSDFLDELETRIESWNTNSVVCDTLASRAPYFKLYSMYAAQLDDSQTAYEEALKKFKPFCDLVQLMENSNLCKGLPLTSYMLYPIQRIPRYKLLLKEYLKHLPDNHPDKNNTEEALKIISEVAQHLNDRIRDLEEQATIVKLQKLFTGKETLVVPGRKFVLRGPVDLVSGKKLNRRKTRILFLFSDVLLMTKIARNIKFKILMKFSLAEIQVSSMSSHSHYNDFCIFLPSVAKPFRLCARDRRERDIWVGCIRKTIAIELDRMKTFESKVNHILTLKETNKRALQSIYHDPSFEPRQPKCARKTFHPRRHMTVNPNGGIEDTDGPANDGAAHEFMFEMEAAMIDNDDDDDDDFIALRPGLDNTMSSYIHYKREGQLDEGFVEMWFVLTYTGLTGYYNHKCDDACWAIALAGCRMILSKQGVYMLKLISPQGAIHLLQLNNEYDYTRWRRVLQEILNSDVNKI